MRVLLGLGWGAASSPMALQEVVRIHIEMYLILDCQSGLSNCCPWKTKSSHASQHKRSYIFVCLDLLFISQELCSQPAKTNGYVKGNQPTASILNPSKWKKPPRGFRNKKEPYDKWTGRGRKKKSNATLIEWMTDRRQRKERYDKLIYDMPCMQGPWAWIDEDDWGRNQHLPAHKSNT